MSPNAIAALHALRDLGAIAARWSNPGYQELRLRNLASATFDQDHPESPPIHRLTPRGEALARDIIVGTTWLS